MPVRPVTNGKNIKLHYQRPYLYPKQHEAIFDPRRISIIEASTKSGKTSGCITWLFEQALNGKHGYHYWWVAPILRQADIAFGRAQDALQKDLYTVNLGNHTMTLINGTKIWFLGADHPDSLYGEDVHAVVIDEASRMKEGAWHAVYSTLTATKGKARIIGNVKGRRNWFFERARYAAKNEDPEYGYHRLTSHDAVDAGVFDAGTLAAAERTMPHAVFRELYMAEPSDDQGNPFGLDAIRKCTKPVSTRPVQVWGIDLAKSVDWSVAIGLDDQGQVCRFERWQSSWEATHLRLQGIVNKVRALCDSTGVGDPVVERLQKVCPKVEGFKFTPASKQQLMEGLAVAIQQGNISFPEGPITQELEMFEYEYTNTGVRYSAPADYDCHDDCVMALALAQMHRSHTQKAIGALITDKMLDRARMAPRGVIAGLGRW